MEAILFVLVLVVALVLGLVWLGLPNRRRERMYRQRQQMRVLNSRPADRYPMHVAEKPEPVSELFGYRFDHHG